MVLAQVVAWIVAAALLFAAALSLFELAEARGDSGVRAGVRRAFFHRRGDSSPSMTSTYRAVMGALVTVPVGTPSFLAGSILITVIVGGFGLALALGLGVITVGDLEAVDWLFGLWRSTVTPRPDRVVLALVGLIVFSKIALDAAALAASFGVARIAGYLGPLGSPIALLGFVAVGMGSVFVHLVITHWLLSEQGFAGITSLDLHTLAQGLKRDPQGTLLGLVETVQVILAANQPRGTTALMVASLASAAFPTVLLTLLVLAGPIGAILYSSGAGPSALGRRLDVQRRPISALGLPVGLISVALYAAALAL